MAEITWPWQYNFPPFFTYISEGNVHIVLQLLETEYVVRLIKKDENNVDVQTIKNSVDFVNLIMIPLLSHGKTSPQDIVELSTEHTADIISKISSFRPEKRQYKSILSPYAIKVKNLTILNSKCDINYCIEIKPKEGFMAASFKTISKCYYCLKQYLKFENREISSISEYCPIDLFSGDRLRMKRSLLGLVCSPQNNFKLFKDGRIIYDDSLSKTYFPGIVKSMKVFGESLNLFLDFIIEILLSSNEISHTELKESTEVSFKNKNPHCVERSYLEEDSFLYKLLQVQKLEEYDASKNSLIDVEDYISSVVDLVKSENLNLYLKRDREIFLQLADARTLALISSVAKDCSIMISFTTNYIEGYSTIQIGDTKLPYKIAVTDLEPKNIKTLEKRKRTEKKIIDIYEKYSQSANDKCKIQPHSETRAKQLEAWQHLIADYLKAAKQSTIDIRESQNSPLFNNTAINRKLSQEAILTILEDMAKNARASPVDKSKNVWEVYWHSIDEWGNMIYNWACNNGMNNSVCTIFELREGDNTVDQEFHGLDMSVLMKALRELEKKGRCEVIEFDDNQGVKFF